MNGEERPERDRPRVEWKIDKIIKDGELAVQINRKPIRPPQFSYTVGVLRTDKDGREIISRYIPIKCFGRGKISVEGRADLIYKLAHEAEEYIQSERQIAEDRWIDASIEFGERKDNKGRPAPTWGLSGGPGSGKTQKRREAKRAAKTNVVGQ